MIKALIYGALGVAWMFTGGSMMKWEQTTQPIPVLAFMGWMAVWVAILAWIFWQTATAGARD